VFFDEFVYAALQIMLDVLSMREAQSKPNLQEYLPKAGKPLFNLLDS